MRAFPPLSRATQKMPVSGMLMFVLLLLVPNSYLGVFCGILFWYGLLVRISLDLAGQVKFGRVSSMHFAIFGKMYHWVGV